jgi:hypothetical protein
MESSVTPVAGDEKTFFASRSVGLCRFLPSCFPYINSGPSFLPFLCACGQPWFKAVLKGFKVI